MAIKTADHMVVDLERMQKSWAFCMRLPVGDVFTNAELAYAIGYPEESLGAGLDYRKLAPFRFTMCGSLLWGNAETIQCMRDEVSESARA
jgi:hypothetical protein